MFDNIGRNIKCIAIIGMILGIIGSLLLTNVFQEEAMQFIVLILGPFSSIYTSMLVYGFGQLVENSDKLVGNHYESKDDNN